MEKDIVLQLRSGRPSSCWYCTEHAHTHDEEPCGCDCHAWAYIVADAAAEISRLRNRVSQLEGVA